MQIRLTYNNNDNNNNKIYLPQRSHDTTYKINIVTNEAGCQRSINSSVLAARNYCISLQHRRNKTSKLNLTKKTNINRIITANKCFH